MYNKKQEDSVMKYNIPKPFIAFTSPRSGGVSQGPYSTNNMSHIVGDTPLCVSHNREKLSKEINLPLTKWVMVAQCHSDNIVKVSHQDRGKGAFNFEDGIPNADALYTFDENLMLGFMHADCVPVLIYDETTNLIAAIHAGWQGTLKKITKKSITHILNNEAIDPKNLQVIIGPCLSFDSCELNPSLVDIPYELNENIQLDQNNNLKLNVAQMNINQCLACGIPLENINRQDHDTFSNPKDFFSFQRDNQTGRHISAIARLKP